MVPPDRSPRANTCGTPPASTSASAAKKPRNQVLNRQDVQTDLFAEIAASEGDPPVGTETVKGGVLVEPCEPEQQLSGGRAAGINGAKAERARGCGERASRQRARLPINLCCGIVERS
jgi:hypothetical protein